MQSLFSIAFLFNILSSEAGNVASSNAQFASERGEIIFDYKVYVYNNIDRPIIEKYVN